MKVKLPALLASGVLVAVVFVAQSDARPRYSPYCRMAYPGLVIQSTHYQAPNGTYDSYSNLVKSVNGTPCGVECSRPWQHVILFASPPGFECF